jgi:hypothetical protein
MDFEFKGQAMSTVTIINPGNGGYANGGSKSSKDSTSNGSSRGAHAVGGLAAVGVGAAGLFTAWRIDDRFFSTGKAGEYFQKQPVLQQLKSWYQGVKDHPKGGRPATLGIEIASALVFCLGLHWLKKAFTGSSK